MSTSHDLTFKIGSKAALYNGGQHLPSQVQQALQQEWNSISQELEAPEGESWKLAYTLPKSLDQLRSKRSGWYQIAGGSSVFASGLSDYAHSLWSGWYGNRELDQIREHLDAQRLANLFETALQERSRLTTSFHKIKPLATGSETTHPIISLTESGIRLQGKQTFGADALFANELLVFFNQHGEKVSSGIAVIPVSSEQLEVQVHADLQAGITVIYNSIVIPWERILVNDDAASVKQLTQQPAAVSLADYQWIARQLDVLELIAGTAFALAEENGLNKELHIQTSLGEIVQHLEVLKAFIFTAEEGASANEAGLFLPSATPLQAARKAGGSYIHHALDVLDRVSQTSILDSPHLSFSGQRDNGDQATLLHGVWALIGGEQAYRRKQHELYTFGDPIVQSALFYQQYAFDFYKVLYTKFWSKVGTPASQYIYE
jgi:4-hydroxyphenylacetate 3-monooxygenase